MAVTAKLKKSLIFVHRWMGVAFSLLFLLWFASAIGMMYWDFPAVTAGDQLQHESALDASKILLSPLDAFARTESTVPPDGVVLTTFDGRPVYRFRFGGGEVSVYADDGKTQDDFPPALMLRIASAWAGQPASTATVEENVPVDQWTVSEEFEDARPLSKYSWPDGQQVYVSAATGDVVQYTTRASRMGAYFGPIPHWLYFTPLRRHGQNWSHLVIWASGLATVVALLGLIIAVWTYSPSKRYRRAGAPANLPYSGNKRWHAILGLVFGPLACSWVFSGMLSMDPFPKLQGDVPNDATIAVARALRQRLPGLVAFDAKRPPQALIQAGGDFAVKELELTSFAGEPVYLATSAANQTRIIPVSGQPVGEFDRTKIVDMVRDAISNAAQPAEITQVRDVTKYESYYLDRHHALPLPVIFVQLNDQDRTIFYVNPKTARIVESYDANQRGNRWFYHGFHSLNLPILYKYRPAWDVVVIVLLLGGIAICVTSLLLAWGVLRRN